MKILLADDHCMFRDGLRHLLARAGIEVVAEASSGRETLPLFELKRPDVLIMDICMPDLGGLEATRQLLSTTPTARVIALSMKVERQHVRAMFAAGCSGYVVKSAAADELVQAVHEVAAGKKYVSPSIAHVMVDDFGVGTRVPGATGMTGAQTTGEAKALSRRETEVLALLAEGHSSKIIAEKLSLGMATVESHRRHIMDKVKLRSVAELTKYAIREGLTSLDC